MREQLHNSPRLSRISLRSIRATIMRLFRMPSPPATPVAIEAATSASASGHVPDELDSFHPEGAFEDPDRMEEVYLDGMRDAENDPEGQRRIEIFHEHKDRKIAFASFAASALPRAKAAFLARFGLSVESDIVDVGCGSGRLVYTLHKLGYKRLCAMDPNRNYYSGTGYLSEVAASDVTIINDIDAWRRDFVGRFDAVITQATIHHWPHIGLGALDVRRNLKPRGYWFAFDEFFAASPREFITAMKGHAGRKYNCYEWAYPAPVYVDLLQSVGVALVAVIPLHYRGNELIRYKPEVPSGLDLKALDAAVDASALAGETVDMFWREVDDVRRGRRAAADGLFTKPQVLVFQRIDV